MAILNPPSGPARLGAYDFARDAFFEGIGGVRAALSSVNASPCRDLRWLDVVEAKLNRWRWALADRLTRDLDDLRGTGRPSTGLVAVLATSHEASLPKEAEDDLRGPGFVLMLAIAGLHMASVSGFVYAAARLSVAATPALAVRIPGHKLAALCGLLAVLIYLALSGAHPSARRAAVTASVAFLARLTDRRAISLHALSIAALIVHVLEPECVVQPGFQMSFCAIGALVAVAEGWHPARDRALSAPWIIRAVQTVRDSLACLAVVATVAGLATGPFSIQHFNLTALYGTPASLLADFLASAVVMPAIALAAGIEACRAGPVMLAPVLWRGHLRWIGVVVGLAVLVWPRPPPPMVWLGPDATNAADIVLGQVAPMCPDRRQFAFESFAQYRGQPVAGPSDHFQCSRDMCLGPADSHPRLAAWFTRRRPSTERLRPLCQSDILLLTAPVALPPDCRRPLLLRPETFRQYGSAEVLRHGSDWQLDWTGDHRGHRPSTRPPSLAS
jgi:competence protein ComEC